MSGPPTNDGPHHHHRSRNGKVGIKSGDVYWVGKAASCQFSVRPIAFRVIREHPWSTYDGYVWLDGYELNAAGDAVARRSIFVIRDGLAAPRTAPRQARRVA